MLQRSKHPSANPPWVGTVKCLTTRYGGCALSSGGNRARIEADRRRQNLGSNSPEVKAIDTIGIGLSDDPWMPLAGWQRSDTVTRLTEGPDPVDPVRTCRTRERVVQQAQKTAKKNATLSRGVFSFLVPNRQVRTKSRSRSSCQPLLQPLCLPKFLSFFPSVSRQVGRPSARGVNDLDTTRWPGPSRPEPPDGVPRAVVSAPGNGPTAPIITAASESQGACPRSVSSARVTTALTDDCDRAVLDTRPGWRTGVSRLIPPSIRRSPCLENALPG